MLSCRGRLLFSLPYLIPGHLVFVGLRDQVDRHEGDDGHREDVEGDRQRRARGFQQPDHNDRREATRKDRRALVADRSTRVAHPRAEHLGEKGGLRTVHHAQEHLPDKEREGDQERGLDVHEPEHGESPEPQQRRARKIHGTASQALRERGPSCQEEDLGETGDQNGCQHDVLGHPKDPRTVVEHAGDHHVVGAVYYEERTPCEQHLLGIIAEHFEYGRAGLGFLALVLPLLQLPERGGILQAQLYVEGHTDQDDAEQERYAPAPRRKRSLSHDRHEDEENAVPEDEPDGNADLGEAPVEAPLAFGSVLRRQQDRPALLAADGEPLTEAQHEEDYRGGDPDGGVRRQETDQRGRRAHSQQRYDQGGLTTQLVPKVAE